MVNQPRILVSPLDWGLGHATRCIPIISHLLERNCEVIIATHGYSLDILRTEFPALEYLELQGYDIRYSSILPAAMAIALQLPKIDRSIAREHKETESICKTKKIDAIISDNRYGVWSEHIPSIIITHQLNIRTRFAQGLLRLKLNRHLSKFNECWIPDYEEGDNLSGALSHPCPTAINVRYIGLLSRFNCACQTLTMEHDLLVLLSGPEPQRSILEEMVIRQVNQLDNINVLIVRGIPGGKSYKVNDRIELIAHLGIKELSEKIGNCKVILSRPGYSTIMDLAALGGKRVIFVPTPGQTEQEYLAGYFDREGIAISCKQNRLSLTIEWLKVLACKGFSSSLYPIIYKQEVDRWLQKI